MRFFYSGGNYNNTANGLASFNGNNSRGNSTTNYGFRAALPSRQMLRTYRVRFQSNGDKGVCFLGFGRKMISCIYRRSGHLARRLQGAAFEETTG